MKHQRRNNLLLMKWVQIGFLIILALAILAMVIFHIQATQ